MKLAFILGIVAMGWQVNAAEITNVNQIRNAGALTTILTDSHHRTLYVFDPDQGSNKPTCNAKCAEVWAPYTITPDETKVFTGLNPDLAFQVRDSGLSQLTYKGRPVYFFNQDRSEGDIKGNGVGGVWHIVEIIK
jgi:predicted lipoprotein with Yx(FWY)xxD motif